MNKLKKSSVLILLATLSTSLFAASPKIDYAALGKESTPENSVVLIYFQQNDFEMYQINPEYEHDIITVKNANGCTTPMKPESTYLIRMLDVTGATNWLGAPCIPKSLPLSYLNYYNEKDVFTSGARITVPSKPGLYLEFFISESEADKRGGKENITLETYKNNAIVRNFILSRLKKSAKLYAGTEWETLINEHIQEWSK